MIVQKPIINGPRLFSVLLFLVVFTSCNSQQTETYNAFHKDLDSVLFTCQILDHQKIKITGRYSGRNKKVELEEKLHGTAAKNVYYFNAKNIESRKEGTYMLVELRPQERTLILYMDTLFAGETQVNSFLKNEKNLKAQFALYLPKDITPELVKNYPPVTAISAEALGQLKIRNKERVQSQKDLRQDTGLIKNEFIFWAKQMMWVNNECLLLGYKPPQTKGEYDGLFKKLDDSL